MIDPDTMQQWSDADRQRAEAGYPVAAVPVRRGNGGRGSGSGGNIPPQPTDVMALEVRLRSLFVGELEARVVVAVRDAVAPIMRDVEAMRVEVARLSALHPKEKVPK